MSRRFIRVLAGTVAAGTLMVAGCDRSPVDPPGHSALGTVVIVDRTAIPQVPLATWTHTDGWDRTELTTLSHAAEPDRTRISLGVRMWTQGGQEILLVEGGEYEARYGVTADPDGVIDTDPALDLFHGDHLHVYGFHEEGRTGTAELVFVLWHDGHSDGQTTGIDLTITD
jgi:hypothetical protein